MSIKTIWTGRILSWIVGLFVLSSGLNLMFIRSADLREGFAKFGMAESTMTGIGLAAVVACVLYLIPRTSPWGVILLTGYLGGAVATHVRIADPTFAAPATFGILAWVGLYLRDQRLRDFVGPRR
jgi:hypothetical protein